LIELRDQYSDDTNFEAVWGRCTNAGPFDDYHIFDGLLFKEARLCMPNTSLPESLIWELHAGGLFAHPGRDKTITLLAECFYWPHMTRDISKFVKRCSICQHAKDTSQNTGLYTPLPILDSILGGS
jgi:hypothetical protein